MYEKIMAKIKELQAEKKRFEQRFKTEKQNIIFLKNSIEKADFAIKVLQEVSLKELTLKD